MLAANPQIEASSVRYFNSSSDFNLALYTDPMSLLVAVHFSDDFKKTEAALVAL